jgi:polysaccharide biosynthesis/export protein VpsN
MRQLRKAGARCAVVSGLIGLAMLLAGCQSENHVFEELPGTGTGGTNGGEQISSAPSQADVFHVGDAVKVTLSSPTAGTIPTVHEEHVKEDGTITPPDVGPVRATGRTTGDLQKELQEKYDRLYRNMTVTVTTGDRYYYVDGEVNQRGPKAVLGETDIIKAISAAGGFTDYARKSKVRIIRTSGQTDVVDYNKAIEDPGYNVRIYPGDKVWVPRRFW